MKTRGYIRKLVMIVSGFLLISCLLPGMIPLNQTPAAGAMPTMEKDANKVIEALTNNKVVRLEALAKEQYTDQDTSKPGTLTYTSTITDDTPTYFSYGWCTTTEDILNQNFDHIKISLYFDNKQLGKDVVHPLSFTRTDGMVCGDFGVLMTDWTNGTYQLKAVATFDDKINDGIADYAAGDYIFVYNVTVKKGENSSPTPSPSP
jgi:hypothetical protein